MQYICMDCGNNVPHAPDKRSKTGNVFCDQTCAARFNNRKYVKRKAQHHCCECGAVIWGGSFSGACGPCYKASRCLDNQTLAEATQRRTDNNRYTCIRAAARRSYLQVGLPLRCLICDYALHVEICHMQSISDFPKTTLISTVNALSNLVAMCRNCHWEHDHGLLDGQQIAECIAVR